MGQVIILVTWGNELGNRKKKPLSYLLLILESKLLWYQSVFKSGDTAAGCHPRTLEEVSNIK